MYLAKLTYNSNNWINPSGPEKKLVSNQYVQFFESQSGFGWEEWNFSPKMLHENKYYGFLQPVHCNPELRRKIFKNVYLFSQQKNLKCYLIGKITELKTLSLNDSREAREAVGHITEMGDDVLTIDGDIKIFNDSINISINCSYSDFKILINNVNGLVFSPQHKQNNFKDIFEIVNPKMKDKILNLENKYG